MQRIMRAAGTLALAAVLASCGSDGSYGSNGGKSPTATSVAKGPAQVTPVPKPAGKPVLELGGTLANRNLGTKLAFDQKTLDQMATVTSTIYEPFLKRTVRFTGIPMADLLGRAGISPKATKVAMHALDDYKVEFNVADLTAPGVLLATRADGAPIPIAKGGPVRLVFPPDSAVGKNRDYWIWSIDTMTVR